MDLNKNHQDWTVKDLSLEYIKKTSFAADYYRVARIRVVHSLKITIELGKNTNQNLKALKNNQYSQDPGAKILERRKICWGYSRIHSCVSPLGASADSKFGA